MLKRILKIIITSILMLIISIVLAIGIVCFVKLLPTVSFIIALILIIIMSYILVKENEKTNKKVRGKSHMKLFKTVDEKFKEIGFIKVQEDEYGVSYERQHNFPKYLQRLDIFHKLSGRYIVQSYDPYLMDDKKIGNTCVGLTMYEMKLCIKKIKQMRWKVQKF